MEINQEKKDYLSNKSILFIGSFTEKYELVVTLQNYFKTFESSFAINYIEDNIDKYDIILCLEDENSLKYLQKVRKLNQFLPFVIIAAKDFSNSSQNSYMEDKLSYYIETNYSIKEIINILKYELEKYDIYLENILLEERNRSYVEMLDKFVIVSKTDLKGRITYVNDLFCEINKFSREELLGRSHNIVRHPDVDPSVFKELWKKLKNNEVWEGTLKNRDKEGETYIVKSIISPFYEKGVKVGYMAVRYAVTDELNQNRELRLYITKTVTELKKQLRVQAEQYEQQLKNKDEKIAYFETLANKKTVEGKKGYLKKLAQQEAQLATYDEKIKNLEAVHQKRVSEYLNEKRSSENILESKNKEILQLKDHKVDLNSKISELEDTITDRLADIEHLKKKLEVTKDLLQHREEQLSAIKKGES